jgi:hypothetical protein
VQVGAVVDAGLGQVVEQHPLVGEVHPGLHRPGVGEQPQRVPEPAEVHADAGYRTDRPLEAGARAVPAMRSGAGVQQQGRRGLPGPLLPADHQLAGPRGGPPVHLAQVVAVPVFAGGRVVLAAHRHRAGHTVAAGVPGPRQADRWQWQHCRHHGQPVGGGEAAGQLDEPERVGQPQPQRADAVAAAHVGAHRVPHSARGARAHPVQHEPGPAAQSVRQVVLEQQQAGGQVGDVLQLEHHLGGLAGGYPGRHHLAGAAQPEPGAHHHAGRDQWQRDQEAGHPEQVLLPEQQRAQAGRDPSREQAAAPGGQGAQRGAH